MPDSEEKFSDDEIAQMRDRYIAPVLEQMRKGEDIGPLGDMIQMNFSNRETGQRINMTYSEWVRQANEFDRKLIEYMNTYIATHG